MTRILIAGAGATGGALGARLIIAGRDVTYLVREGRAAQLARTGLRFRAPDLETTLNVSALTSVEGEDPFDVIVVATKAPALPGLISTLAPVVGPETCIVPLLNGMAHIDALEEAFPGRVLAGVMKIVATLDEQATVVQMTPLCTLTIGGLHGDSVPESLVRAFTTDGIEVAVVDDGASLLWEKWAFIAAAGVVTCLFRGTVGDILSAGGEPEIRAAIDECERIAAAAGHRVSEAGHAQSLALLTEPGSAFTSSLYRDLQHGDAVEAEHIIGDLTARAQTLGVNAPLLRAVLVQLRTHHESRIHVENTVVGSGVA